MRAQGTKRKRFEVAVLPLLDMVLFPGTTLPLQILEDRYRQMIQEIQANGWPLAISLVISRSENEMTLNTVCGAGVVELTDDRSILVHGTMRVRLKRFVKETPYFLMEAETFESSAKESEMPTRSFTEFLALAKTWVFLNPDVPDRVSALLDRFTGPGELADFFAFHFLRDPQSQQEYLSCANPLVRSERLARFVETDLARMSKKLSRDRNTVLFH